MEQSGFDEGITEEDKIVLDDGSQLPPPVQEINASDFATEQASYEVDVDGASKSSKKKTKQKDKNKAAANSATNEDPQKGPAPPNAKATESQVYPKQSSTSLEKDSDKGSRDSKLASATDESANEGLFVQSKEIKPSSSSVSRFEDSLQSTLALSYSANTLSNISESLTEVLHTSSIDMTFEDEVNFNPFDVREAKIESLKVEAEVIAIASGAFKMEENIRLYLGAKVYFQDKEIGEVIGPFGKLGKCKVKIIHSQRDDSLLTTGSMLKICLQKT
jgi:hypothetical protein